MAELKRRLLGLGLPCLLAFSFDVGMTLHGQPVAYWAGDYSQTNEGSPFFRNLFMVHPLAAVAGEGLWAGIIVTWILLMPEVVAVILAVAIVFGHSAGGYTWLGVVLQARWFQTLHGVLLISATVLGAGLHWMLWVAPRAGDALQKRHVHPLIRWSLLVAASALACYMYLIPQ
jgi:hypothetical protein